MVWHYYTYMLVDPRNGLPFYVGKGQRRRCFAHIHQARTTTKNNRKLNKIRKIESLGLSVEVRKVEENVTDDMAIEFECLLIQECRAKGINLTNETDGGEGSSGYKHTAEAIEKIRATQLGVAKPESQKEKLREYTKENNPMYRPEVVAKTTGENHWNYGKPARNKGTHWTDEQRKAQSERFSGENHNMYGKPCSDERREAIRKATTGVKKSTTVNMCKPKSKEPCPHCGQMVDGGNMKRWHGDNCKENIHV